ncbi:undecaprenyldiphospho-muramoylpentapeptide beta-N-acetylglucosaminyltransferase [Parapedobacter sp. ISTM3]|uniref:UDP-N-acetylglucosamine--N-acetylmuramyl-(pentapeptide) pyrophosphoryl-undecaprenol N-acetylglucosamine transferase n=1 Tax=Parapedobacter luteus TaxID=623280 RepID=A0A1T5E1T5_9SPHI|nr:MULTISPECIES: undecaprenyldiphospho-muramoylpentapeptide beta-N-acetylglucosaminyltransferase [Parapedobacter]MBK1441004.1 undecaprenyldiphospho-muramoylpentapeptide beta-N-acetylglucosaminyltransferase [Parapedobacter sp. ISTM3]SKB77633.1 UDP-N-acetylglucosamine-N-acetylmuramylpentapeptide N-acetylglucosamine transferase [Parapedobacter luteus]
MAGIKTKRIIISGGGTGGHIFPAIAIANALKRLAPDTELLFVGAEGKMEMDKVPAAGYEIIGLDIQGINRKSFWKNLILPFKLYKSIRKARQILHDFKPDVAVGVGGYASGPLLHTAVQMGIPCLIQEQNSYAGITNKRLGAKVDKICVAFEGMDRFFPKSKILLTGNPIRRESVDIRNKRFEAAELLSLSPHKKTILLTGGSLGARTLNTCMRDGLDRLAAADVQLIWQCGGYYYDELREALGNGHEGVKLTAFLHRMDLAYAAADVIIARAGAGTIAELCAVGKPAILVPSPNVAEDHQTKNAMALVDKDAALMVSDMEAPQKLVDTALALLDDEKRIKVLRANIGKLAIWDADEIIAREVLKLAGE